VDVQQGRFDDAISAQRKASESFGSAVSWSLAEIARDYALEGKSAEARQALQDLLKGSRTSYVSAYGIATIYAALGDKDQAFAQLEQALAHRSQNMDFLKVDRELDSLRSDPRFQSLLSRMKLR
jgi:Tfp pilus assembly protein PilF